MIDVAALQRDLRAARDGRQPPAGMLDVVVDSLELPDGAPVSFARPADWDLLCERGGTSPYWAILWPSGAALACAVATNAPRLAGRRVLELGCGLGVPSVVAARAGATVLATDASPEAVVFARLNLALAGAGGDAAVLDVAQPRVAGTFDVVLVADLVYDRRNVEALVDLVPRVVAHGGEVWLADPGRPALDDLVARWPADIALRVEAVATPEPARP